MALTKTTKRRLVVLLVVQLAAIVLLFRPSVRFLVRGGLPEQEAILFYIVGCVLGVLYFVGDAYGGSNRD